MALLDALYALVIFLSAFLLFLVEPMTAKLLLPALGGSAAVWITCLAFFQTLLLAGYLYAHLVSSRLRPRGQAVTHATMLGLALVSLAMPVRPGAGWASWHPLLTTFWMLTALIGLPFVALAATTPLLQSWRSGGDPRSSNFPLWWLFAVSNLGAMLALVLYPWLVEPHFALGTQRTAWAVGFALFAMACAALAWGHAKGGESPAIAAESPHFSEEDRREQTSGAKEAAEKVDISGEIGRARPSGAKVHADSVGFMRGSKPPPPSVSSLSAACKAPADSGRSGLRAEALTCQPGTATPVGSPSVPDAHREAPGYASPSRRLLWVLLPAASSMLLCAITSHLSQNVAAVPLLWIVPLAAYLLSFIITFAGPNWYLRSHAARLLAFALATVGYLLAKQISVPLLISVPVYVGALFVFCYFCHGELYRLRPAASQTTSYYLPIALGSALGAIFVGVAAPMLFSLNCDLALSLIFLVALALAATWKSGMIVRIFWTAGAAAMVWAAILNVRILRHDTISQLRGFYGSLRVTQTFAIPGPGIQRMLFNGTIQHGIQVFNDQLRHRGTSYYAPDSGVGLALRFCCHGAPRRIGAVGLGVGTIAAYAEPGDSITFYEIDPLVERLARARFSYLRECRAPVTVILGDARVSMEQEPPQNYDVIVLDAFSGDAIPVHLLTAQAIALYRRHLKPGGVLAFHISSQYLDLAPVLAAEARHADMIALGVHSLANDEVGEFQADWVLMSADPVFFQQPEVAIASRPIALRPGLPLWTDDFNSLLPLVKWTGFETGVPPGTNGK